MRSVPHRYLLFSVVPVLVAGVVSAQEAGPKPREIRAMRYPAISPDGGKIAFSYRGDLWTVPSTGGEAKKLAELPGYDGRARWSPDGHTLAFCTDKDGQFDIYTLPASGGTPKQVTFHSADDVLSDWSPDGQSLLFTSARDTRTASIWSLRLSDGRLQELARDASALLAPVYAPDGKSIVYARGRGDWARQGYRGSSNTDLWALSLAKPGLAPRRLTTFTGNDMWPQFSADGKSIYFTSDPDNTGNLWKMPLAGGKSVQVTRQRDGYIHYPNLSRNGKLLAYETDFSLWTVDPASKAAPSRLKITAAVEDKPRVETRKLSTGAREMEPSPDGSQIALGYREDIWVVPVAGGEAKRLTDSQANDWDFVWTPDGNSLIYVSTRGGQTDLYQVEVATGVTKRLTNTPEPESGPNFSPDGRWLSFLRGTNGGSICVMPTAGGEVKVAVKGPYIGEPRWSPDSKWMAYSRRTLASVTNVYVSPVFGEGANAGEINVSRWTGINTAPVWSGDGKKLSFISNRQADSGGGGGRRPGGGGAGGFTTTLELYTVDLAKPKATGATGAAGAASPSANSVAIDPVGLERRVKPFSSQPPGMKSNILYTPDGKTVLFTVSQPGSPSVLYQMPLSGGGPALKVQETIGGTLRLSTDGKTLFNLSPGLGTLQTLPVTGGTPTVINYTGSYPYDLNEERRQTFDQAWLMLRENFYDAKMHGVDWLRTRARLRPIVDECTDITDFHLLLQEMVGELNASHTGANRTTPARSVYDTASLGLLFDWSAEGPGLKVNGVLRDGPADQDDARIATGEYILAVGGKDVTATESFATLLNDQGGKALDVLVNSKPSKDGARTVKLTPVPRSRVAGLIYENWVENNRQRVEQLSGGKMAYLHIQQMDQASLTRFERELITLAYDKQALVLDVRNNPGGRIHDDLFAILTKKVHAYETPRDALKMTQPFGAFTRPMTLLINGGSFSDAEIFANGFRANGLGKVIGMPTGGGVIGTQDRVLMDGQTRFRVPQTGWHDVNGKNLENWGVPPDYFVDLLPEDVLADRDPQLERAVKELLPVVKGPATRASAK